ncbi:MAG: aldo/keto reductase [bacterium]
MQYRKLGRTGIEISEIAFGCGAAAGLLTSGDHEAQLGAVRRALDLGINHFDTAPAYGAGSSETNLGRLLEETGAEATVSTKVRLGKESAGRLREATVESVEGSLARLGREAVDIIQLHNHVAPEGEGGGWSGHTLSPEDVLGEGGVLEGFRELRERGRVRHFGFTGLGAPDALHALVDSGAFDTIQAYYNLLNPTGGHPAPPGFGALDYGLIIDRAAAAGMGVLAIRILGRGSIVPRAEAGGKTPKTLSRGSDFPRDAERGRALGWLTEGFARTIPEAAIRFALMKPEVSTVLLGFSETAHVEEAAACTGAGGLPEEAMARLRGLWESDFR